MSHSSVSARPEPRLYVHAPGPRSICDWHQLGVKNVNHNVLSHVCFAGLSETCNFYKMLLLLGVNIFTYVCIT